MSNQLWMLLGLVGLVILIIVSTQFFTPRETSSDAFAIPSSLSGWERIDDSTLAFKGDIVAETFQQMKSMLDRQVKTLVITSRGGRVEPAIRMGKLVVKKNLSVVVERYCLSSCANYIFLADKERAVREGIVGFHGNITYSIRQAGGVEARVEKEASRVGLSEDRKEEFKKKTRQIINMEQEFIDSLAVSQEFFNFTARILNEQREASDQSYDFVVPLEDTFSEYDIRINGTQSRDWKRRVEQKFGMSLLLY